MIERSLRLNLEKLREFINLALEALILLIVSGLFLYFSYHAIIPAAKSSGDKPGK